MNADTSSSHPKLGSGGDSQQEPPGPSILLVDDQPSRLFTYEAILGDLRLNCVRALSGEEALKHLLRQEFAAIVLDVNMPGMDGFETARYIREHPKLERMPIIFVTGVHVSELDQLKGYEVGAIDYISVPVVPEILRSKIALLVELYNRRSELSRLNRELEAARQQLQIERDEAISSRDAEEARRVSDADRAEKEWLAAVLDSMTEEVYFTDRNQCYTYVNPAAAREFGHTDVEGVPVTQIIGGLEVMRADGTPRPASEAPPLRALAGEVIRDEEQLVRIPRTNELRHRQVSSAPVRDRDGTIIGSVSVVRDITEQKRTEAMLRARDIRSSALLDLGDQFRALTAPGDLAYVAARLLGETLDVSRCGYGTIDIRAETITIERDWNARGIRSLGGTLHFRDYGTYIDDLKRGETVVCPDTRVDPRTGTTADRLADINVRSFVNMPIIEKEGVVAVLYLNHCAPRLWTQEELSFIREVAERTRIAVERRRSEQAVAADLRDMQLLRNLAARLVVNGDEHSLLQDILTAAMAITEADAGTIRMLDESTQEFVLAATRGFSTQFTAQFERIAAISSTSCGLAFSRGERTVVHFDVPEGDDPDGSMRLHLGAGFQSAQSTPLVGRSGTVLGMLSTHWRTRRTLSDRQSRFVDLLARSAADLVQRFRDEQALRDSEQQLRNEAKRKDEFLAILAHELRNPLASISAAAHLLTKVEQKPAVAAIARDALQRQARHMARLLDDLLDVARVTHGLIELQLATVNLTDVIVAALETIKPQLELKGHRCQLQGVADPVYVHGDAVRLTQVMTNLMDNAAKYTPAGGQVTIQLRKESDHALVVVADTGIGISSTLMPHIFDLFSRAHGVTGPNSGLGIGLSLVKALVNLHGGTIEARSAGEAMGSEFLIRLPLSTPPNAVAPALDDVTQRIDPLRILVADDNTDNANAWRLLLEGQGHEVHAVFDGRSALLEASRFQPDVALLDIGMPYMSGHEVGQAIRAADWGKQMVLVAVTGWGQAHDRERTQAAGFDHHLTKPTTLQELERVLRCVRRSPAAKL